MDLNEIPTDQYPQWLNNELFQKCLNINSSNSNLIKILSVKPAVSIGQNYASNVYRVLVGLKDVHGATEHHGFVIKSILPSVQQNIKELNIFSKEVLIYTNILSEFENEFKKCGENVELAPKFYTSFEEPESVLVFEDLNMRNYVVIDRLVGLGMSHSEIVLKKLSKFHAASMVYRQNNGDFDTKFFIPIFTKRVEAFFKTWMDDIFPFFLDCIKQNEILQHLHKKIEKLQTVYFDELCRQSEPSKTSNAFNVFCHGDLWNNNCLFSHDDKDEPTDVILIDYQISFWGSPAYDLYYFLVSSTQFHVKEEFDYFIYVYYTELVNNLSKLKFNGKIPSLRELHIELLERGFLAIVFAFFNMALTNMKPTNDLNLESLTDQSNASIDKRAAMFISPIYLKNLEVLFLFLEKRGAFDI